MYALFVLLWAPVTVHYLYAIDASNTSFTNPVT